MSKISHDFRYRIRVLRHGCAPVKEAPVKREIAAPIRVEEEEEEEEVYEGDISDLRIRYPTFASVFMKEPPEEERERADSDDINYNDEEESDDEEQTEFEAHRVLQFSLRINNGFAYREVMDSKEFADMYRNVALRGKKRYNDVDSVEQNVFDMNATTCTQPVQHTVQEQRKPAPNRETRFRFEDGGFQNNRNRKWNNGDGEQRKQIKSNFGNRSRNSSRKAPQFKMANPFMI